MLRGTALIIVLGIAGGVPLGTHLIREPEVHSDAAPAQQASPDEHPLAPVLDLARRTQRSVETDVQGFRCCVTKRERIEGELQDERSIDMHVRECADGEANTTAPFSARLDFQAPAAVAGRQILYVEGEHDDRMLVRKGGQRLDFIVLRLDPLGPKARAESHFPITSLSYQRMLAAMVGLLERQIEADPRGANTRVQWTENADAAGRSCRLLRVLHPERDDALVFRTAGVWIDQQLGVPIRIEAHGWPAQPGEPPPLLAEYTYTDLELNARHGDDCFDAASLRSN